MKRCRSSDESVSGESMESIGRCEEARVEVGEHSSLCLFPSSPLFCKGCSQEVSSIPSVSFPRQIASGLFTPFHADTPGVERFAQEHVYQYSCFASSAHVSGPKLLTCRVIYHPTISMNTFWRVGLCCIFLDGNMFSLVCKLVWENRS